MASPATLTDTLNGLIETCKNGENGFRTAAENVKTPDLRNLFNAYSAQRALFVTELQTLVQRLGGQPQEAGSLAATLHRGWINLRSLVTGADEAAIVAECERGEDIAVQDYEDALNGELPAEVRTVVQRQSTQVKEAHDRVHALQVVCAKA